jgi:hypothetical protein
MNAESRLKFAKNDRSVERIKHLLSDQKIDDSDAIKLIFREDDNALPALVAALQEGRNVERASWALASLGGPKEREILQRLIGVQKDPKKKWLMSSFLAGALVEPSSEQEWNFLANCLKQYRQESRTYASFSAALALGINGSPKALHLLQAALPQDQVAGDSDAVQEMRQAIHWIEGKSLHSKESIQTGSDSEQIKRIVLETAFYADGKRESVSTEDIVFTRERSRALVSVQVDRSPNETQGYDIVLERNPGAWKIVAVWATWAT